MKSRPSQLLAFSWKTGEAIIISMIVGLIVHVVSSQALGAQMPPRGVASARVSSPFAVQVLLDRSAYSVGEIDGKLGKNTRAALGAYQASHHLKVTNVPDKATITSLHKSGGSAPTLRAVTVSKDDLDSRRYPKRAATPVAQARQRCMCYRSPIEMLAERHHVSPTLLRQLNIKLVTRGLHVGDRLRVPNVVPRTASKKRKVARLIVTGTVPAVQGLDADSNTVFYAPASVASNYATFVGKRTAVARIVPNPSYHYRPEMFGDRVSQKSVTLPAGPNTPVGAMWIGLRESHLGLHGTPHPETIAYASSHGCVRMTNADAERLASLVSVGTTVEFR